MPDLRSERLKYLVLGLWGLILDLIQSLRPDFGFVGPDLGSEKARFGSERIELGTERPDLRSGWPAQGSKRPDLWFVKA